MLRKDNGWSVIPAWEGRVRILRASWPERLAVVASYGFDGDPLLTKMEGWLRTIPDISLGPLHARVPMQMCTHAHVFTHLQICTPTPTHPKHAYTRVFSHTHTTYTWQWKKEKHAIMNYNNFYWIIKIIPSTSQHYNGIVMCYVLMVMLVQRN